MPDLSHTAARIRRAAKAALSVFLPKKPGEAGYRELGRMGEEAAEGLLRSLGYSVLGRNVQVPMGEADIVCRDCDRETIVIVEVKTRLRRANAPAKSNEVLPEASITAHKRPQAAFDRPPPDAGQQVAAILRPHRPSSLLSITLRNQRAGRSCATTSVRCGASLRAVVYLMAAVMASSSFFPSSGASFPALHLMSSPAPSSNFGMMWK